MKDRFEIWCVVLSRKIRALFKTSSTNAGKVIQIYQDLKLMTSGKTAFEKYTNLHTEKMCFLNGLLLLKFGTDGRRDVDLVNAFRLLA